jgi:hypothetical protein
MQRLSFLVSLVILASLITACASRTTAKTLEDDPTPAAQIKEQPATPPVDCPVTTSEEHALFKAPQPYSTDAPWDGIFWFGSKNLWTALDTDGIWEALPHNPEGYTQKIFWWSDLYVLRDELEPALEVIGRRLDAEAPPLKFGRATNAYAADIGDAMLTGVDFPTLGCWEITAHYKKTGLTFVVWVAP